MTVAHTLNGQGLKTPRRHRATPRRAGKATGPVLLPPPSEPFGDGGGRGADGRFTRGNRGGPGNPFARRVAALRTTLLEALTPERMQSLALKLVRRAEAGDMAAAALLFRYALGKPPEVVDPDRLDLHEWELLRDTPGKAEFLDVVKLRIIPALASELAHRLLPTTIDSLASDLAAKEQQQEKKPSRG